MHFTYLEYIRPQLQVARYKETDGIKLTALEVVKFGVVHNCGAYFRTCFLWTHCQRRENRTIFQNRQSEQLKWIKKKKKIDGVKWLTLTFLT